MHIMWFMYVCIFEPELDLCIAQSQTPWENSVLFEKVTDHGILFPVHVTRDYSCIIKVFEYMFRNSHTCDTCAETMHATICIVISHTHYHSHRCWMKQNEFKLYEVPIRMHIYTHIRTADVSIPTSPWKSAGQALRCNDFGGASSELTEERGSKVILSTYKNNNFDFFLWSRNDIVWIATTLCMCVCVLGNWFAVDDT